MRTPDPTLLADATAALAVATGLTVELLEAEPHGADDRRADATLRLRWNGEVRTYPAERKGKITGATPRPPTHDRHRPTILVTRYVTRPQAKRLRELEIPFIDTAGNAYLNDPPLYVFLAGSQPHRPPVAGDETRRLYRPGGLRVIFVLLCAPELAGAPMREIARAASVALGTVKGVFDDLVAADHLPRRRRRGRPTDRDRTAPELRHRDTLIRRWTEAYAERLRPKLLIGRYAAPTRDWWRGVDPARYHAAWGGEVAAFRLTQYLEPATVTLYVDGRPNRLLAEHRLRRADDGPVEVLERFWRLPNAAPAACVPPLLAYADLLAIGDHRTVETAVEIHERWLAQPSERA